MTRTLARMPHVLEKSPCVAAIDACHGRVGGDWPADERTSDCSVSITDACRRAVGLAQGVAQMSVLLTGAIHRRSPVRARLECVRHFQSDLVSWRDDTTQAVIGGCFGRGMEVCRSGTLMNEDAPQRPYELREMFNALRRDDGSRCIVAHAPD